MGVGSGVAVGSAVAVDSGVAVVPGVGVGAGVDVGSGLGSGPAVGPGVGVAVASGVEIGVGSSVSSGVGTGVGSAVGVACGALVVVGVATAMRTSASLLGWLSKPLDLTSISAAGNVKTWSVPPFTVSLAAEAATTASMTARVTAAIRTSKSDRAGPSGRREEARTAGCSGQTADGGARCPGLLLSGPPGAKAPAGTGAARTRDLLRLTISGPPRLPQPPVLRPKRRLRLD